MAYLPDHVLQQLLEKKAKLFEDGYEELNKRYEKSKKGRK